MKSTSASRELVSILLILLAGLALWRATAIAGWIDWPAFLGWIWRHGLLIALINAALIAVVLACRLLGIGRPGKTPPRLTWWMVAIAAAIVAGVTWGSTSWLLSEAIRATDPAAARVDAIKTGLSIGAATAGIFALLLAVRRQWHQEAAAADLSHDAGEKRITEQYTKAVEQLGSDKAHVRLGGLYALERVAQNNPAQRQTIVNVLCAYLRMPYTLPGEPLDDCADNDVISLYNERIQEREVRLAAQRLLKQHLTPQPEDMFWEEIDLDLTGAALINFQLVGAHVRTAMFTGASFHEGAYFIKTTFTFGPGFSGARFHSSANFVDCTFNRGGSFGDAQFSGMTLFRQSIFMGPALFIGATFADEAHFAGVKFTEGVQLDAAQFSGRANFSNATFSGECGFVGTIFDGPANFVGTTFNGDDPWLHSATFTLGTPREVLKVIQLHEKAATNEAATEGR
ncbi:Pentapeptide repeat-containing protein [Actinokineospora alba]|uniref:Pentapeptide repeat-containing protein n=1 Tax=Actinokineospora alba TaxID=504798 RepID=A0A1H0K2Z9_9PSEU|nr:pentapeptide repeat-containing protein [Actinokineospora alba]TDP68063.1 pentapeptide repeat protein [Actinokineospora alba]SDH91712.1 Pentapeptide repeat-containing protein [Actinokineospora alba]SDO50425.1 Pentapeptide repeat-containing protein [Actinokineospora alba]